MNEPPEIIAELQDAYDESLRIMANVPDTWIYRDISWMREDLYDMFIDVVGEDNIEYLTTLKRVFNEDQKTYVRTTMFISPHGMINIETFMSIKSEELPRD